MGDVRCGLEEGGVVAAMGEEGFLRLVEKKRGLSGQKSARIRFWMGIRQKLAGNQI